MADETPWVTLYSFDDEHADLRDRFRQLLDDCGQEYRTEQREIGPDRTETVFLIPGEPHTTTEHVYELVIDKATGEEKQVSREVEVTKFGTGPNAKALRTAWRDAQKQ